MKNLRKKLRKLGQSLVILPLLLSACSLDNLQKNTNVLAEENLGTSKATKKQKETQRKQDRKAKTKVSTVDRSRQTDNKTTIKATKETTKKTSKATTKATTKAAVNKEHKENKETKATTQAKPKETTKKNTRQTVTVQKGEGWWHLGERAGVDYRYLAVFNKKTWNDPIYAGETYKVPTKAEIQKITLPKITKKTAVNKHSKSKANTSKQKTHNTAPQAYRANCAYLNGACVPLYNGPYSQDEHNINYVQGLIDAGHMVNIGPATVTPNDGVANYLAGHNPGIASPFNALSMGSTFIITDGKGTPHTLKVREWYAADAEKIHGASEGFSFGGPNMVSYYHESPEGVMIQFCRGSWHNTQFVWCTFIN